jgi:5'-nucleotidase
MFRRFNRSLFVLLLCGCNQTHTDAGIARPTTPQPRIVTLTILSTNDVHGQLEPLELFVGGHRLRVGGAEALLATLTELRAKNPEGTILIDAGDLIQGSLLSNTFEGLPMRDLLALARYDAMVIGNHEFDFGPRGPRPLEPGSKQDGVGALRAWAAGAPFPVLVANIREGDRPVRWKNVVPSVVIKRKGIRIGLVGVITPTTVTTTLRAHIRHLRFLDMATAVRREARALRRAGVGVVIVVAHAGGTCNSRASAETSCKGELFADLLERLEPGDIDAVIGAHTHKPIWHTYRKIPVIEACARTKAVGRLELEVDRLENRVVASRPLPPKLVCHDVYPKTGTCEPSAASVRPNPLLSKHSQVVKATRAVLRRYEARLGPEATRVLGRARNFLPHQQMGSTTIGTLFANAMLEAVPGADFVVLNAGSFRADIPAGPITRARLFSVFPFDNRLASVRLRGSQIEQLVDTLLENSHGVLQTAGLKIRLRCASPARRAAMTDVRTGRKLEPTRHYIVVLSDFLLSGGDGLGPLLDSVPDHHKKVHRRLIREVAADFLRAQKEPLVSPPAIPLVSVKGSCLLRARSRRPLCR